MKYLQGKEKVPDSGILHYLPHLFIMTANTFWPLSWIYNNENNVDAFESAIIRGIATALFNYLIACWRGYDMTAKSPSNFRIYIKRNILITFHTLMVAGSQFILPLPIVHTINCSGIMMVFLIDYLVNGVEINFKQGIGVIVGFLGVVLNANGNLIMTKINPDFQFQTTFANYITTDPIARSKFSIFMLLVVAGWAYSVVQIKSLKGENSFQANYHMALMFILVGGIVYPFFKHTATLYQYMLSFIWFGIPITIAQFFFAGGLTMSKDSGILTMMNFIGIIISYIVSIFRYGESPNMISITGIFFVFLGVSLTIGMKNKK